MTIVYLPHERSSGDKWGAESIHRSTESCSGYEVGVKLRKQVLSPCPGHKDWM